MDYKALYRKWRPKTFEEVLGQDHITLTLRNQILNDNVAHAYLFSGIRGTGKTSTAKIFARALNCLDSKDGNPCNACENCMSALSDNAIDIIEIDAASNNGVDDIRDLREKTKYPPSKMKYKVYIIDEVHMLSIGAFNALLKTLEEPPSYIVFIFATTEIHKIPATIISRCQKYELKRIKQSDIIVLMKAICDKSGFTYEMKALEQIARMADGAARDSLSILDQCFAADTNNHITNETINDVLGLITEETIFELVKAINENDAKKALLILNETIINGKDIKRFINQLIEYYRYLMLAKVSNDISTMISVSEETKHKVVSQGKETSLNLIIRAINILTKVEVESKWSSNSRVLLEIGLIKILQPDLETSLEALTERIEKLENRPVFKTPVRAEFHGQDAAESIKKGLDLGDRIKKDLVDREKTVKKVKKEEESPKDYENNVTISLAADEQENLWEDVLDKVKERKISTHALLIDGKFEGIMDNCVCISYGEGYGFHMIAVDKKENKEIVENAIYAVYGAQLRVKYVSRSDPSVDTTNNDASDEEKILNFVGDYQNKLEFTD